MSEATVARVHTEWLIDLTMFTDLGDPGDTFPRSLSVALDRVHGLFLAYARAGPEIGFEAMFEHRSIWTTMVEHKRESPAWTLSEPKMTPLGEVVAIVFVLLRGPANGNVVPAQIAIAVGRPIGEPGAVQSMLREDELRAQPRFQDAADWRTS